MGEEIFLVCVTCTTGDHDLSPWDIDPIAKYMDGYISYNSTRNISDSSTICLDKGITLLEKPFRTWDPHPCHLSFMDNTLVPCVHWSHENISVGMERLVELWSHFLEEYLGMYSLSLIHPYIGELHILIEGPSKLQHE